MSFCLPWIDNRVIAPDYDIRSLDYISDERDVDDDIPELEDSTENTRDAETAVEPGIEPPGQ